MIAQAEQTMTESRYREAMARTATTYVAGALALGLREQGLSDKAIGEVLTVSRNRVPDLVKEGIWPSPMLSDDRLLRYVTAAVEDLYRPIAHPTTGWVHSLTGLSGRIAIANGVSIPPPFRPNEERGLDTIAAQFDNLDTGERILVYSLERHHGQVLFDAEMRLAGYDFMGYYRIDLCSPAGDRQSYPLEVLRHLQLRSAVRKEVGNSRGAPI